MHAGKTYLVDVTECKPEDQICVIETDLNVDFDPPKDYVEPVRAPLTKSKSTHEKEKLAKDMEKVEQRAEKFARVDGKGISEAQKKELLAQIKKEEQEAGLDFDPRKFRLKHGVRGYIEPGKSSSTQWSGGVKLG
jgi:hypothetical protein